MVQARCERCSLGFPSHATSATSAIALAFFNLVLALYIQQRVDEGLARRLGGTPSGGEPFLPTQAPATRPNRRLVSKEVKTLLLYDVVFASLARYCYGEPDAPHAAALLQIFYAVLAVQYAVCWSCIQMCAAQLESCFPSGPWSWRPRRRPRPAVAQQPVYVCAPYFERPAVVRLSGRGESG